MAAGTVDMTAGSAGARPANHTHHPFKVSQVVDLAAAAIKKGAALETNEVLQAIVVPAGMFVAKVFVKIVTQGVGTGSLLAEVGDGDDPNGYDVQVDLEAAAGTLTTSTNAFTLGEATPNTIAITDAYNNGKHYSVADTIDLVLTDYDAVTTAPVIRVTAIMFDLTV